MNKHKPIAIVQVFRLFMPILALLTGACEAGTVQSFQQDSLFLSPSPPDPEPAPIPVPHPSTNPRLESTDPDRTSDPEYFGQWGVFMGTKGKGIICYASTSIEWPPGEVSLAIGRYSAKHLVVISGISAKKDVKIFPNNARVFSRFSNGTIIPFRPDGKWFAIAEKSNQFVAAAIAGSKTVSIRISDNFVMQFSLDKFGAAYAAMKRKCP